MNMNYLIVEGINHKGFGVIPKAVMIDKDLTIEAKAIYAYFASYAGNGNTAFPTRNTILSHLKISKERYYKNLHLLDKLGFILINQNRDNGIYARNIYTLVTNPKKFENLTDDVSIKVKNFGLKSTGFGIIPKAVMIDPDINISAKAIYAYICCFSGNGFTAPTYPEIKAHLRIGEDTFLRHRKLLLEADYIRKHMFYSKKHKCQRLFYEIVEYPENKDTVKKQNPENKDTVKKQNLENKDTVKFADNQQILEYPKNQDTVENIDTTTFLIPPENKDTVKKQNPENKDTVTQDINITIFNKKIDRLIDINKDNQNFSKFKTDEFEIEKEILSHKKITDEIANDDEKLKMAIKVITDFSLLEKCGFTGINTDFKQLLHTMFVSALHKSICSDTEILKIINQILKKYGKHGIAEVFENISLNFTIALEKGNIKSPEKYFLSCLKNELRAKNIKLAVLAVQNENEHKTETRVNSRVAPPEFYNWLIEA